MLSVSGTQKTEMSICSWYMYVQAEKQGCFHDNHFSDKSLYMRGGGGVLNYHCIYFFKSYNQKYEAIYYMCHTVKTIDYLLRNVCRECSSPIFTKMRLALCNNVMPGQ